ncbi:MAG: hypothetical protein V7K48_03090, partial [Nostoc sp.]|uniref:hypothetical protein n=1 Tax=Nostoc sp. TaxID=1180 RepID=UPI002FF7A6F7
NSTSIALLTFQGFFCSFFYSEYPESDRRGIIFILVKANLTQAIALTLLHLLGLWKMFHRGCLGRRSRFISATK